MQITHLSNSFIVVQSNGQKLCCDPWVGFANHGGWHSYPEYSRDKLIAFLADTDLVYISHLHEDHFDPKFLVESGLIRKPFVIKNFDVKTLYNRLTKLGADVTEVNEFDVFTRGTFRLAIIPQMTSNSSDLEDDVNYDLDTSIVVSDGDVTLFNQVDNPLSAADYAKLNAFIVEKFGPLSVAGLMCGAASEYPQAFINVDRNAEKEKIIAESLERLEEKLAILKPRFYFPEGGTYFIPGKLHRLFKYLAQPTPEQIVARLEEKKLSAVPVFIEGGKGISVTSRTSAADLKVSSDMAPLPRSLAQSIAAHEQDPYLHESDPTETVPPMPVIKSLFEIARENWLKVVEDKDIAISQNISFVLYSDLLLDDECKPRQETRLGTLKMNEHDPYPLGELVVHVDVRAFVRCLTRKQVWNGTIGSLCLFERRPNTFHPSDTFSLNFLTVSKEDTQRLLQ